MQIAENKVAEVQATFAAHGAVGPELVWQPRIESLGPPQLQFLLSHWQELAASPALPLARRIDALELQPALGHIALLDVLEEGRDFRYRVFGTVIAAVSGFEMTGQNLSCFRAKPYIVEFFLAVNQAVLRRREPVFTRHSPPPEVSTTVWNRLILPFVDENGAVVRLISGIVPSSSEGRPIRS